MRSVVIFSLLLIITLVFHPGLNRAMGQQPAPVENVSSFPPRTAAR